MKINIYSYEFPQPIGNIGIAEAGGKIVRVVFGLTVEKLRDVDRLQEYFSKPSYKGFALAACATECTDRAAAQFAEYLDGRRAVFELPLAYEGYRFASKIYGELLKIPAGEVRSYRDIAESCGAPTGFRVVGMANRNNPIPFFIPCHRVIGSNGSLTGYTGGLEMKRYLLDLEKKHYAGAAV